ncbi:hypothetical protein ABPG75_003914 [Micractinium tetrahymenae]
MSTAAAALVAPAGCRAPTSAQRRLALPQAAPFARRVVASRALQQQEAEAAVGTPSTGGSSADAGRRYLSLLPPFFGRATELEEYVPGRLWDLAQPLKLDFQRFDIRLRMVVTRLPDGSLLLISPVAPTGEALSQLASIGGEVSHIVLPSSSPEHWFYGPALSDAFPNATVWAVPGLLEGQGLPFPFFRQYTSGMRPRCKALGQDPLPPELQGQLDAEVLTAPFFIEAAVVLPQHGALLLADTGFCMDAKEYAHLSQANIDAAKKVRVWDQLGPITRAVFEAEPEKGQAWVQAVLAREGWDLVIPAHASSPIRDGRRAFQECFAFLSEAT